MMRKRHYGFHIAPVQQMKIIASMISD